jgi:hypothetical protein
MIRHRFAINAVPIAFALLLGALLQSGCVPPPPGLSPQARQMWQGTRVIHDLDVVRDIAIDANKQIPPLLSEASTRQVVLTHKTAITIIHELPAGWQQMVLAGLDGLEQQVPKREYEQIAPYVAIARAILRKD